VNAATIDYVRRITADPYPQVDYRVCRTEKDITDYWTSEQVLGCDTESYPSGHPYCLTFSHTPGTGRLVYREDAGLVYLFGRMVENRKPHLLFHNYLHDVVPFTALNIPIEQFTDTMVRAYNLCLGGGGDDDEGSKAGRGSLGLKQLAYRFLNMRMTSFKDTVFPYSIPHLKQYLNQAQTMFQYEDRSIKKCQCGCLQDRHLIKGKRQLPHGQCTGCKGCDKYRAHKYPPLTDEDDRLNRLYRKVSGLIEAIDSGKCERDEEEDIVNPWVRVKGWHDYDHKALIDNLGQWPVPSIAHVPEDRLVYYAVRDADATLRLYHFLKTHHPWVFYS
jgi:hypothetical protein